MLVLPNQITPKYLIDNPGPWVLSVCTSHPSCSQMSHEYGAATVQLERDSEVNRRSSLWWKRKTFPVVVSCHRALQASGLPPWDHPPQLPVPCLYFPTSRVLTGIASVPWLAHQSLGCTSQAFKPCSCPALRPKKEPSDSDRDIKGFSGRGSYTSEAKGPGAMPHHVRQVGRPWPPSPSLICYCLDDFV